MSLLQVHDELAKLVKKFALQRFGEEVTDHFSSRAAFDGEFLLPDTVSNEVETTVEMFGSLAAGQTAIIFE